MKKITISDISRIAGVSRSTVSRVLTNNPNVNENTRKKVQEVIKKYDFLPNSLARGLALGRINVIAAIIGDIRNPFNSELIWVIENILNENGYMVVLCDSENDIEKEKLYMNAVKQYGFAGAITTSAMENNELSSILKSMGCPVVLLNRYIRSFEGDVVIIDNFEAGYIATRYLIELGHHKIGFLIGPTNSTVSLERLNGYKRALENFYIKYDKNLIATGDLKMKSGHEYGLELLKHKSDKPTAVLAGNDLMAIGIMEAYKKNGLKIPEDLSIIGFDDIPISSISGINLTTIRQPFQELGKTVSELILKRINNEDFEYKKVILNPKLVVRGTTMAIKK